MRPQPTSSSVYRVRKYDSLWKIAQSKYGDSNLWPEIARANVLPVPDRIFVGQEIYLPDLGSLNPAPTFAGRHLQRPKPAMRSFRLPTEAQAIAYPAFKSKLPLIERSFAGPGYIATFKMEAEFVVQKQGVMDGFTITNLKDIETKYKYEYQNELARMGSELKLKFDPESKRLEFSGALTHTVRFKGKDWMSYELSMPTPKTLLFLMKPSPVEGRLQDALLKGEVGYEMRIEFTGPSAQPARQLSRALEFQIDLRQLLLGLTLILVVAVLAVVGAQTLVVSAVCVVAFLVVKKLVELQPAPTPPNNPSSRRARWRSEFLRVPRLSCWFFLR